MTRKEKLKYKMWFGIYLENFFNLKKELDRTPLSEEMAITLGVDLEKIIYIEEQLANY
jgi:hypothetical protein